MNKMHTLDTSRSLSYLDSVFFNDSSVLCYTVVARRQYNFLHIFDIVVKSNRIGVLDDVEQCCVYNHKSVSLRN